MNSYDKAKLQPKVSIGMPAYNNELFIRRAIDSLLAQTFTDFELIISDDASTDNTPIICEEYSKKDKRIRYIRQKKNIGLHRNFFFLLQEAKYDYFMWSAADDFLDPKFIEKNLNILVSNNDVVCSVSKIKPYGTEMFDLDPNAIDTLRYPKFVRNLIKRGRWKKIADTCTISGSYEKKIRTFLTNYKSLSAIYGIYRTDQLRKCIISKPFICVEVCIFLNLLKYGNLYEIDEAFLYKFDEGFSTRGVINVARGTEHNFLGIVFPFYPFTFWCIKHLGIKNFLKNIDVFIRLNLSGEFYVGVDLILMLNKYITKNFDGLKRITD